VADAIKIIRNHGCIFAVKSGGHAMFEGASNANGGITIDLRLLNQLEFVGEEKGIEGETTRIGPGARWREVYKSLEPLNRTVVGGRNSHVGVGGFILGGEFSPCSVVRGERKGDVARDVNQK
jgi:FAD/FMN-containing dehydrogenase